MKTARRRDGAFTLVELLVVVAIIGLISSVAMVAVNTSRRKSRDAKRLADIKQIITALALYQGETGTYPAGSTLNLENRGLGSTSGWVANPTGVIYVRRVPTAPLPRDGTCTAAQNRYRYTSTVTSTYSLTFCLGADTSGLPAGQRTVTPAGIT